MAVKASCSREYMCRGYSLIRSAYVTTCLGLAACMHVRRRMAGMESTTVLRAMEMTYVGTQNHRYSTHQSTVGMHSDLAIKATFF